MRRLLATFALCAALPAQTFVVDVNNGPGTNFTDLSVAVTTVPDGAVLLVRAGTYQSFTIANKGLTILGDPGVSVDGVARVDRTTAAQRVTLAGLGMQGTVPVGTMVHLTDCAGPVVLERITTPATMPIMNTISVFWAHTMGVVGMRCDQVTLRSCTITGVSFSGSACVIESCTLIGATGRLSPTGSPVFSTPALTVGSGSAHVAGNSSLTGGDGLPTSLDAAGLYTVGGTVDVRAGRVSSGSGSGTTAGFAFLIASGRVRVDPAVVVTSTSGQPAFGGSPVSVAMPSVTATSAPIGGVLRATVATALGDLVLLVAGLPGPPSTVRGLPGAIWLDPASLLLSVFGVQTAGAAVSAAIATPSVPSLRGLMVAWQALALGPAGLSLSNPSLAILR